MQFTTHLESRCTYIRSTDIPFIENTIITVVSNLSTICRWLAEKYFQDKARQHNWAHHTIQYAQDTITVNNWT